MHDCVFQVKSGQVLEPVYADNESFQKYSGWFMPSVNEVSCSVVMYSRLNIHMQVYMQS